MKCLGERRRRGIIHEIESRHDDHGMRRPVIEEHVLFEGRQRQSRGRAAERILASLHSHPLPFLSVANLHKSCRYREIVIARSGHFNPCDPA